MAKLVLILFVIALSLLEESLAQRYILPTYRPPVRKPVIIRNVRDVMDQPLWLYEGDVPRAPSTADHPRLPMYIDDVRVDPNRRYARSLDSPSAKRGGGTGGRSSGGSHDTGATHPGHNRRNARDVGLEELLRPKTHRDVIIPNWNPNARIKPWQVIGGHRPRREAGAHALDENV